MTPEQQQQHNLIASYSPISAKRYQQLVESEKYKRKPRHTSAPKIKTNEQLEAALSEEERRDLLKELEV